MIYLSEFFFTVEKLPMRGSQMYLVNHIPNKR